MDRPSELPLQAALTPLYGREQDLSQLLTLLRGGTRLLTLRGPGGIGKTTLALHLAQALSKPGKPGFDHVQLIDLSALRDPDGVLALIAASLPDSGLKGDPRRRIQTFVSTCRTLLILDNFEQLLPAAPALSDLLASMPTLHLIVTSRAALRLHDEVEFPVEPLKISIRLRDAASSAAVQLFVARVQLVRPSFELNATTTTQVVRLCEVLEGVPLALELAAMRIRTYSLSDLLTRLEHPLEVLKADFRDRPERLQSLRAAVQWSYDLLGDVDRAVFECCAVFDGPFTPQALADVWGSPEVLDHAEMLLEQSLLQRLDVQETLWKMLQPLKELAMERLDGHPQVSVWRERHTKHFLNMIEEHQRTWQIDSVDRRAAYLPHYPNIRAGLVWASEARQSDLAFRYLSSVSVLWIAFGLSAQEWPLVERVLALPEPGNRLTMLKVLEVSANTLYVTGQFEAREAQLHEILKLSQELSDVDTAARTTLDLARVAHEAGHTERALESVLQVMNELKERIGDRPPTRTQLTLQANLHLSGSLMLLELARHGEAVEFVRLAGQSSQLAGNTYAELSARGMEGYLLVSAQRLSEGHSLLLSCLQDAVERGFRGVAEDCLRWGLTLVAAEVHAWTTLVQFIAFIKELPYSERSQSLPSRRLRQDTARAREVLGEAAYQQAWTTGTQLQLMDMVELAVQLAHEPASPALYPELTPREHEVLALVSQGHPDRRVARLLGITSGTASKHVGNLLGKLGLRNRVELACWAIEHATPQAEH